jgi:uncharacterized protein (TIGR02172 family)
MAKGPLIGKGRTAEVYEWNEDRVLKLYFDWFHPDWIEYEAEIGRAVHEAGVSSPAVYNIVEVDGRKGLEYQRVCGETMLKLIQSAPWRILHYGRNMARLHAQIHGHSTNKLPQQKDKLRQSVRASDRILGDRVEKIIKFLEALPSGSSVCHGDFHPDNILIAQSQTTVIDWTNSFSGNSLGDVARTCLLLQSPYMPEGPFIIRALAKVIKKLLYKSYLKEYMSLTKASYEDVDRWILPTAAARLIEQIPGEEKWLLSIIDKRL